MIKLTEKELKTICGGAAISGAIINAYTKIIDLILEIGRSFGSSLRRLFSKNICPLK